MELYKRLYYAICTYNAPCSFACLWMSAIRVVDLAFNLRAYNFVSQVIRVVFRS